MKKILFSLLTVGVVTFAGCGSAKKPPPVLPPHYNYIFVYEGLYCTGSANVESVGEYLAKFDASVKTRDELKRLAIVKIKRLIQNFSKTIGIDDPQIVDSISKTVSTQAIDTVSIPLQPKKVYYDKNNKTIHVFMAFDDEMVRQVAESIKTSVLTTLKNKPELWDKFQTNNGLFELEKEISEEFGGNKIVKLHTFD